jgi:hypothetical protein
MIALSANILLLLWVVAVGGGNDSVFNATR